jgi:hypothetical protein
MHWVHSWIPPNQRSHPLVTRSSNHPSPKPLPSQAYHSLAFGAKVLWPVSCRLLILLAVLAKQYEQNTLFNGIRSPLYPSNSRTQESVGHLGMDLEISVCPSSQTFTLLPTSTSTPLFIVAFVPWIAIPRDGSSRWGQAPTACLCLCFQV